MITLWCAVAALGSAVAFVLAPVEQPVVTYHWPVPAAAPSASPSPIGPATRPPPTEAAIPLMPYQPVALTASFTCSVAAGMGGHPGVVLLSTVPLHPDPAVARLPGLEVTVAGRVVRVRSGDVAVGAVPVPARGSCTVTVSSDPRSTRLLLNSRVVGVVNGDFRPAVTGMFTQAAPTHGIDVRLTADTRFQTTPTVLKQALGWLCVAAMLGTLAGLAMADRRARPAAVGSRFTDTRRRRLWPPRPVDAAVTGVLVVWLFVGAATVDDGYIATMIRSRGSNGFIGNVYRWLNAPEAPFSWYDEVLRGWAALAPGRFAPMLWMRVPATVLGLVCWLLLSRFVLPRLGVLAARRWVPWVAAVCFAGWWLPFDLGLRPEPWVAVGVLGVWCAIEHAIATRRVLPLTAGFALAAATVAETPAGLMATAGLLAAVVPVLRLLRARADLHRWPLVMALLAAPASALLLMFTDQSPAAVVEATQLRLVVGGGPPWYQEYQRYADLLDPVSFVGNLTMRGPVLLTLLAVPALGWLLFDPRGGGRLPGVARGPARRLVGTTVLALAALTLSPTKWTYHFGGLTGVGAALLTLLIAAWSHRGIRAAASPRGRELAGWGRAAWMLVAGTAAITVVSSLVLAGRDTWPFVSDIGIPWSGSRPRLGPLPLAELVLAAGAAVVAALTTGLAWRRAGPRGGDAAPRWLRLVPAPGQLAACLLAALVLLNLGSFAEAAVSHRRSYTLARDDVQALAGSPCGLAQDLDAETDPAAGLLVPADLPVLAIAPASDTATGAAPADFVATSAAAQVAGIALPGWRAPDLVSSTLHTGWYRLPSPPRPDPRPVVITLAGTSGPSTVAVEFARTSGTAVTPLATEPLPDPPGAPAPRDARILAPAGADLVRLHATSTPTPGQIPLSFTQPRVPRTVPLDAVLPPGATALLDWPVASVFPCLRPAPLTNGTAELPSWRIAPPRADVSAGITYDPASGGPFAGPATLVHQQAVPVYLRGDPTREVVDLYRWVPITPLEHLQPTTSTSTVSAWQRDSRATVPRP